MALHFGAKLSEEERRQAQSHLHQLLKDLEPFITTGQAAPSPSLRRTLTTFAMREPELVRPEFMDTVDQLMGTALAGETSDQGRAFRHLRTLYSSRRPLRQSAMLPVETLEEHGLSSPDLTVSGQ
jgi:hypothetical protein